MNTPHAKRPVIWPAYALGAVFGCILGLIAAELSFALTRGITGRGWADGAWWQYVVAGVVFLLAAMLVMLWLSKRVRAAGKPR